MSKRFLVGTAIALCCFSAFAKGEGPKVLSGEEVAKRQLEMYDLNRDGVISLDEFLVRPKEMFKTIDKNKDGVVDVEEIRAAYKQQEAIVNKLRKDSAPVPNQPAPAPSGK